METQPAPRTHQEWSNHFLPEAEAHVAELQRLGYYVSQPYAAVQTYCSFAALDAIHLGKTEIDFGRARDMAERMAGVRDSGSERIAA